MAITVTFRPGTASIFDDVLHPGLERVTRTMDLAVRVDITGPGVHGSAGLTPDGQTLWAEPWTFAQTALLVAGECIDQHLTRDELAQMRRDPSSLWTPVAQTWMDVAEAVFDAYDTLDAHTRWEIAVNTAWEHWRDAQLEEDMARTDAIRGTSDVLEALGEAIATRQHWEAYLRDGMTDGAWETFLVLSQSWDGTLADLIATAKAL